MGKIVLIALIISLGSGGYWFYWEENGANKPITIEYNVAGSFMTRQIGIPIEMKFEGNLRFYMKPNICKVSLDISRGKNSNIVLDYLMRLDTKKWYAILPGKEMYNSGDFDLISKSKLGDSDRDASWWFEEFNVTLDGKWFGKGTDRYYARKHTLKTDFLPAVVAGKVELWFSNQIDFGSKHIETLNSILRIKGALYGNGLTDAKGKEKVPKRLEKSDFPYFPLPLAINIEQRDRNQKIKIDITATKISRSRIPSSVFQAPSGYEKVNSDKFFETIMSEIMPAGLNR